MFTFHNQLGSTLDGSKMSGEKTLSMQPETQQQSVGIIWLKSVKNETVICLVSTKFNVLVFDGHGDFWSAAETHVYLRCSI